MLDEAIRFSGVYVLALFRIAGMMISAPLLGSDRIPKRVKGMVACVLAAAIAPQLTLPAAMPQTPWGLAVGLSGEIVFGVAMGMVVSFIFVAAQWSGEIIGQQMGLNLGQTFDPQFGGGGSAVGDLYFFLALAIFICIGGEKYLIVGVIHSFNALPLLTVGMSRPLLASLLGLLGGATSLAFCLAGPTLVTMLVVDLVLGFIGKTVPQLNIMTAGVSVRSLAGLLLLIVGIGLTTSIISGAMNAALQLVLNYYSTPLTQ